jgi:membrane-bound lytic murein transglycosylase F
MSGTRFNPSIVLLVALFTSAVAMRVLAVEDERTIFNHHWPTEFDEHFQKYSKRYFGPHFDWRWFKSQGVVESRLNPDAISPAGAVGIMQILPSTYEEIRRDNPHFQDITDPRWNIAAGIYYDRGLYRKWRKPLPSGERLLLAFASYNAGYGRVLKALRRAPEPIGRWRHVEPHLPGETRSYVEQIKGLMERGEVSRENLHGVEKLLIRREGDPAGS